MDDTRNRPPTVIAPQSNTTWIVRGAVAGLAAGIAMAMFVMVASALAGEGLWAPPRTVTAFFFGESEAGSNFGTVPVVIGIAIHMALSMVFGAMFAFVVGLFTNWISQPIEIIAGLLFGLFLWMVNTFVIASLLPGGELVENNVQITTMPSWAWATGHLIFGFLLSAIYGAWRSGKTTMLDQ